MARRITTPVGRPTRGTTGTNRLRRFDRFIAASDALSQSPRPLVVDLGYGAHGITTLELAARLHRVRPDVRVVGVELDAERVASATAQLRAVRAGETHFRPDVDVTFMRGGFEVPTPGGEDATVIRAANVLRQYDEAEVAAAWRAMAARLTPRGVLIEGTSDEIGRISSWVTLNAAAEPQSLTLSLALRGLTSPSIVAERLPKALIHRNVPGERVHAVLQRLEREWVLAASVSPFGQRMRFATAVAGLERGGIAVQTPRRRVRWGEVTVPWEAVAPER